MRYIRNISSKVIHIGNVMLLPDAQIEDEVPETRKKMENIHAKRFSDIPSVNALVEHGILEIVDVVYKKKTNPAQVRVEVIETDEDVPENTETPETPVEDTTDSENETVPEKTEEKPLKKTTRKKKTSAESGT